MKKIVFKLGKMNIYLHLQESSSDSETIQSVKYTRLDKIKFIRGILKCSQSKKIVRVSALEIYLEKYKDKFCKISEILKLIDDLTIIEVVYRFKENDQDEEPLFFKLVESFIPFTSKDETFVKNQELLQGNKSIIKKHKRALMNSIIFL